MVTWCLGLKDPVLSRLVPSCYILPIIFRILGGSLPIVEWLTRVVSGFFVLASMFHVGEVAVAYHAELRHMLKRKRILF